MQIPFLDLNAQNGPIRDEMLAAISQVIDRSALAGGPFVASFEQEFARFCGSSNCVAVGNGTDALLFALLAIGVGQGDEVITVPNSFIATAEAISFTGARPVFVDVEETNYTMNPALLEAAIGPKTKAIIPVHLYGQMADMDPILEIARRHGIPVIEDACQAHGAEYKGRKAGTLGCAGCFSFYPGKNLGALGEAGAVTTNDPGIARKIEMLRDHGQETKYHHSVVGWNGRMDGIQAAALSIKLRSLASGNASRRTNAGIYDRYLTGAEGIIPPKVAKNGLHVFHLYVVRVRRRAELLRSLEEKGVGCAIHYPCPIHLQKAYSYLELAPGSYPVSEQCSGEILSLPMYPSLTEEQIRTVVRELTSSRNLVAAA
jgi:dTDP-4-amino-4,6-dideoxygalactose transaminase